MQHVEPFEIIKPAPVLAEAIGEAAIVVENADVQQVKDAGSIGIKAIFTRAGKGGVEAGSSSSRGGAGR